ncbi:ABC transporter permease subunit [Nocardia uniformis]|uniref:ABC transporter permease subunit n=1 Tax=Nocardia uniformis TaxID=53432 RepID=A0A849BQB3_9NOCA|nr:ABC transporter permease subunit [Nocardia uniformis]NNH68892.1 ABC transporter permease subunit [Nocardia uniformis]
MTAVLDSESVPPTPRKRRGRGRLATVPLFAFLAFAFGLPLAAIVHAAFQVKDPETLQTSFGVGNMSASLQDAYLNALQSSIKISATVAVLGVIVGTLLAQAVVTSGARWLREPVLTASGVLANFGGVPLAFAWVATLGNAGMITDWFNLTDRGWSLYSFTGLTATYLYFAIPLMILTITPALDGLRPQWREAAQNNGASTWQFWRYIGIPVLTPSLLGGAVLLFGASFAAHATAAAMLGTGSAVPLITLKIAAALGGDVLVGQENVAFAMSLDMILVVAVVMAIYLPLQRRSSRWLA